MDADFEPLESSVTSEVSELDDTQPFEAEFERYITVSSQDPFETPTTTRPQQITKDYSKSRFNDPKYTLEDPAKSKSYIFKEGLFTRALLPIDPTKEREILVSCTSCDYQRKDRLSYFRSSNYVRHYEGRHSHIATSEKLESTKKRKSDLTSSPSIQGFFSSNLPKRPKNDYSEEGVINRVLLFLIENNLSFNSLGSDSFKALIRYLNPDIPIINRSKLKTSLNALFTTELTKLNQLLEANNKSYGSFSLTFDIWTSRNSYSFLGIIATFLDDDFNLHYRLIAFNTLTEAHTGTYIYSQFKEAIQPYSGIEVSNIFSFTRDNASNNNTFIEAFKDHYSELSYKEFTRDIRCIAHIINLVAQEILRDYLASENTEIELSLYIRSQSQYEEPDLTTSNIINRLRRLASLIKYSQEPRKLLLEGLERAKKEGNLEHKKTTIPLDMPTRWNSTYYMIESTLQLRSALTYIYNNTTNREFKRIFFKDSDWAILAELQRVFKVLLKPSKDLQGQTYITNSFTLLYIYQISSKLIELEGRFERQQEDPFFKSLYQAIRNGRLKLEKYFPRQLKKSNLKDYKPYILSHILDPRFKISHFKDKRVLAFYSTIQEDVKDLLIEDYKKLKLEISGYRIDPLGADSANLELSFDELGENYQPIEANNRPDSSSSDDFFIDGSSNKEEYDSYLSESPILGRSNKLNNFANNMLF
ncbi:hypothetical protein NLU13_7245 [Sarocladium strictum]|uniref:Uncharacterized protein n=1 Tax=Sarocladium strictum TaxID=5046 RepID=A0AA39L5E0_SARSR|nr:hypothetical protein NLU13_7245 [Sarocladium strictum]